MGSLVLGLFLVAAMPVIKVLLITALGFYLSSDRVDVLGKTACHHLNRLVFYVLIPSLVASYLAKTVTLKSFLILWFIPVNILLTFVVGSALGWLLGKLTRAPKHMMGLIISICAAGNAGNLLFLIIPSMCKEKGSPFGAPDVCENMALAYASLSSAILVICIWLFAYNILRISCKEMVEENAVTSTSGIKEQDLNEEDMLPRKITPLDIEESKPQVLSSMPSPTANSTDGLSSSSYLSIVKKVKMTLSRANGCLKTVSRKMNLKAVFTPPTIGAIVAFFIVMIPPIRKLLVGPNAPLHVVTDSAIMIGDSAIPAITLLIGANLHKGYKGSGVTMKTVIGITAIRFIFLPLSGILILKGAIRGGLVPIHDRLLHYTLLIQFTVPAAMNIGTITQLLGVGESECSVILLWNYAFATIAMTLWSTFYLWLLAK